jgi:hypothetical protein
MYNIFPFVFRDSRLAGFTHRVLFTTPQIIARKHTSELGLDSWKLQSVNKLREREFTSCMRVVVFNPKKISSADRVQHRGSCWRACWMCCVRTGREINQNYINKGVASWRSEYIFCEWKYLCTFSYVMYKFNYLCMVVSSVKKKY